MFARPKALITLTPEIMEVHLSYFDKYFVNKIIAKLKRIAAILHSLEQTLLIIFSGSVW